jgi:hypothetical protein
VTVARLPPPFPSVPLWPKGKDVTSLRGHRGLPESLLRADCAVVGSEPHVFSFSRPMRLRSTSEQSSCRRWSERYAADDKREDASKDIFYLSTTTTDQLVFLEVQSGVSAARQLLGNAVAARAKNTTTHLFLRLLGVWGTRHRKLGRRRRGTVHLRPSPPSTLPFGLLPALPSPLSPPPLSPVNLRPFNRPFAPDADDQESETMATRKFRFDSFAEEFASCGSNHNDDRVKSTMNEDADSGVGESPTEEQPFF